jgi:hypothetical protein
MRFSKLFTKAHDFTYKIYILYLFKLLINVGSHSPHVLYARELGETSIYVADTAAENRTSIHQLTTHTYCNTVILVHID